jgi:hypothetical protein
MENSAIDFLVSKSPPGNPVQDMGNPLMVLAAAAAATPLYPCQLKTRIKHRYQYQHLANLNYEGSMMMFWDREDDLISVGKYRDNMTNPNRSYTNTQHGVAIDSKATLFAQFEVRVCSLMNDAASYSRSTLVTS